MRTSTSKSEAVVLGRRKVACSLQGGGEIRPQAEEKSRSLFPEWGNLGVVGMDAAGAVMRSLSRSVVLLWCRRMRVKAFHHCSNSHLRSGATSHNRKVKMSDKRG